MNVYTAILKRRSIRRFQQKPITLTVLKKLVNAARLAPSAANFQPLEFVIVNKNLAAVFSCLKWAGYVAPLGTPPAGQRPVAYIAILVNQEKAKFPHYAVYDAAAAAENIILTALESGIGSCWIGSGDKKSLSKALKLPKISRIDSIIALGYPAHTSRAESFKGSVKYWMDKQGNFHVPKRGLKQVLHVNKY